MIIYQVPNENKESLSSKIKPNNNSETIYGDEEKIPEVCKIQHNSESLKILFKINKNEEKNENSLQNSKKIPILLLDESKRDSEDNSHHYDASPIKLPCISSHLDPTTSFFHINPIESENDSSSNSSMNEINERKLKKLNFLQFEKENSNEEEDLKVIYEQEFEKESNQNSQKYFIKKRSNLDNLRNYYDKYPFLVFRKRLLFLKK